MNVFVSGLLRIVLGVLGFFVTLLPRKAELALGGGIGKLIDLFGYRKKVSWDNIRRCLPELGPKGWRDLQKKNYRHLGILTLELAHYFSPVPGHWRRYAVKNSRIHGLEHWRAAAAKGKGALFCASHLGNWELMCAAGALGGIPITMVTKHNKPEWLHLKIERDRAACGIKAAYEPRTLPVVLRALRANEAVGFVMDQYAGPPVGIPVRFFGVDVGTLAAVGTLVSRTDTLILPALTRRDEQGVVHVDVQPFVDPALLANEPGGTPDVTRTTQHLVSMVETWVKKYPDQWLWTHRRFKNVVWPPELA